MSGFLRDVGGRPERERDPLGKAALFSDARQPGTLVVECGSCGESTRVSYLDFAVASLPFSVWLPPLPSLQFNRLMTCPACAQFTWVRAHWTQ